MRALRIIVLLSLTGLLSLSARPASAQEDTRATELIDLVQKRPSGMDRDLWREERRDAARELGSLGDQRAVPILIQIVKTEQFDAVSEIAIVSLGKLGDTSAVPILQEVANDSSRDRYVRKAAKTALRKLGAKAGDDAEQEDGVETLAITGLSDGLTAVSSGPTTISLAKDFGDDMLAASDSLTLAVGDAHLDWDSVTKAASLDGQAGARYLRIRERKGLALRYEGRGDVLAGMVEYDADETRSRIVSLNFAGSAQARMYTAAGTWFGLGSGTALLNYDHIKVKRGGPMPSENFLAADLGVALGGGYGRILDIGERLRIRRLEAVLQHRKMLGRPITADLAERVMRAWWKLRSEVGYHDRLVATVAILREAGVLLGEPDASASYALLQVLQDGQLNHRLSGLQVYLALGENFLMRDDDLGLEEGRVESVFSRASYGRQNLAADSELRIDAFARYRILADDTEPTPWAAEVRSHWRSFRYGPNSDPIGALDIGASAGLSTDGFDASEKATRMAGSVGWLWMPSRATRFRLAGELRYESTEIFLGVAFEGTYGFIDSGFVGAAAPQ